MPSIMAWHVDRHKGPINCNADEPFKPEAHTDTKPFREAVARFLSRNDT